MPKYDFNKVKPLESLFCKSGTHSLFIIYLFIFWSRKIGNTELQCLQNPQIMSYTNVVVSRYILKISSPTPKLVNNEAKPAIIQITIVHPVVHFEKISSN